MTEPILLDNVKLVGDRLHALNELFAKTYNKTAVRKLVTRRYWPQNFYAGALHPFIVPMPMEDVVAGRFPQGGASALHNTQTWTLLLVIGEFELGIPTDTAQAEAELLMGRLRVWWASRGGLALDGSRLKGLVKAEILRSTGIGTLAAGSKLAIVRFPIDVTMLEEITEREY